MNTPAVAATTINLATGSLGGPAVTEIVRTLSDLSGIFRTTPDQGPDTLVYRVQSYLPVAEGVEGGLFWGTTFLEPGQAGDEYFMTKGHFHAKRNRGEYYVTVLGEGGLLLMSEARETRVEWMKPGSVHYIPGFTAHRVANTGESQLVFTACWPSDAGHDYESIDQKGFSARLRKIAGRPELVGEW